jgi:hypothetical protein
VRGRQPNPRGESLTPRQKRVFVIVGGLLAVLVAGVGVWAAASPGSYGRSSHGCVNVVEPSSTGGAVLHQCGPAARVLCRNAFRHATRLDLLTRPQCRLAGLGSASRGERPPGTPRGPARLPVPPSPA